MGVGIGGQALGQPAAVRAREPADAELRVAHHAADRGGRAGADRAGALRVAAGGRRADHRSRAQARARRSGWPWARRCWRCSCTRCSTAGSSRTRSPGWCWPWRPGQLTWTRRDDGVHRGGRRPAAAWHDRPLHAPLPGRHVRPAGRAAGPAGDHPPRAGLEPVAVPHAGAVDPQGVLAPLVRAAGEEWDVGIARSACFLAALAAGAGGRAWPAPARLARVGRDRAGGGRGPGAAAALDAAAGGPARRHEPRGSTPTTRPTRSRSRGDLLLDGDNPYGHDYRALGHGALLHRSTGASRERVREREVALEHFAYFPGTAVDGRRVAAGCPRPFDDYRVFVLLMTLARVCGGHGLPRAAELAAGDRGAGGGQPDRRSLRLVRSERRAQHHADDPGVRPRDPRAPALGRGVAGGGGAAQAVRRGGHPVPRADDGQARRLARRAEGRCAGVSRAWWPSWCCRS